MNPRPASTFWRRFTLLALLASLVLNGALLSGLYSAFSKLQLARIFPLGTPQSAPPPSAQSMPGLVLIGDSRALLWRSDTLTPCFAVTRVATGGHSSTQVRLALSERMPAPGTIAVLQFGINDIHPLGAFPQYGETIRNTLIKNLTDVTKNLVDNGNPVIVTTIFPPASAPLWRKPFWDPRALGYIAEVNEHIRAMARERSVWVLDAAAVLAGDEGRIAGKYVDEDFFLHVNDAGYAALNRALMPVLASVAGAPVTSACMPHKTNVAQ